MPRVATVVVTVVTCDRAVVTLGSSSLTGHAGWVGEEEGVVNLLAVLTLLRGWLSRRLPSTRHGRRRLLLRRPIGPCSRLLLLRLSLWWLPLRLRGFKRIGQACVDLLLAVGGPGVQIHHHENGHVTFSQVLSGLQH
jgi:hypothetical protein